MYPQFSKTTSGSSLKEWQRVCKNKGLEWFASAWDLESQTFLSKFNLKYNKIASAMIVYDELLKQVASEGKHTFISTGMTTEQDITRAVEIFQNANCSFELMHCISAYPFENKFNGLVRLAKT